VTLSTAAEPHAGFVDSAACFRAIVTRRKSVRAFLPDTLPETQIRDLLTLASWAPSNCNTQPWIVHVASGETVAKLRLALIADATANGLSREVPYNPELYPAALHARMIEHVVTQQLAFGIAREDLTARDQLRANNLGFFGAPHVLFLYLPDFANEREAADLGMFAQTFLLALEANGLAGVPQTSVGSYAAPVRRLLRPAADCKLMFAISFGRENREMQSARLVQDRLPVDAFTTFHR
jgi:nitroreductase